MFSKKSFPCFCLVIEADVHGAEFLIFMIIIFISNLSIYLMSVFVCSSNQNLLKDTTLVWVRSTFWSSRRFLSRLVLNFHFPTCGYLVTGEWLISVCVMKIIWRVAYWKNPLQAGTSMFFNCWTECNEFETDEHECGLEELTGRNISYWYYRKYQSVNSLNIVLRGRMLRHATISIIIILKNELVLANIQPYWPKAWPITHISFK